MINQQHNSPSNFDDILFAHKNFSQVGVLTNITFQQSETLLGTPHQNLEKSSGTETYLWGFAYDCGLKVLISLDLSSSSTTKSVLNSAKIQADLPEMEHITRHLDLGKRHSLQTIQADSIPPSTHQVYRQDDNGNRFSVGEPTTERDALCYANYLEAKGHKQYYWIEPLGK